MFDSEKIMYKEAKLLAILQIFNSTVVIIEKYEKLINSSITPEEIKRHEDKLKGLYDILDFMINLREEIVNETQQDDVWPVT